MLYYFPKEELKFCTKGFNLIPVEEVKDKDGNTVYRADLSVTPFHDYDNSVVRISDKRYLKEDLVAELCSYVLLRYDNKWLVINSSVSGENKKRIGLLEDYVNRGEEQRVFSYNFNSIKTGMESGDKSLAVLGYIVLEDLSKVIFINRFDFPQMPEFLNQKMSFEELGYEDLFSEKFLENAELDDISKFVASSIKDLIKTK